METRRKRNTGREEKSLKHRTRYLGIMLLTLSRIYAGAGLSEFGSISTYIYISIYTYDVGRLTVDGRYMDIEIYILVVIQM